MQKSVNELENKARCFKEEYDKYTDYDFNKLYRLKKDEWEFIGDIDDDFKRLVLIEILLGHENKKDE